MIAPIEFGGSNTLKFGDRTISVGDVVFKLLQSLFSAQGRVTVAELERHVWGGERNTNTLWSACRRARKALKKLEYPKLVGKDLDELVLL